MQSVPITTQPHHAWMPF